MPDVNARLNVGTGFEPSADAGFHFAHSLFKARENVPGFDEFRKL
jgi:hypothetical protein